MPTTGETKTETPEKKRRRTIRTSSRDSSPEQKKVARKPAVAGSSLFYAEEEEAVRRDPHKDLELYNGAINEIEKMMVEIKQLKNSNKEATTEIAEKRIHGSLQFVGLKKLNRITHLRCKKARDATSEAKSKIDQHHLQLQNLLYEAMHLEKEITKCLEFSSKDEEIDLVPVTTFYEEAPTVVTRNVSPEADDHQLTLARLNWELEKRKQLSEKLKKSQRSKEKLSQELKTKKEYLESLQPKLQTILQSTKPVQEYLGMPFDETVEQHKTARFLPSPLYILFVQSSAYREACDQNITVVIQGDVDAAKSQQVAALVEDDESDSDQEEQEKHKSKHRRGRSEDRLSAKKEKLLTKHPLCVVIAINCKDGSIVRLKFHYLVALNIVTVYVSLQTETTYSTVSGDDLLSSDSLLDCLYPGDTGADTPNPSNHFDLNRLGMSQFKNYTELVGRPYMWAQWLSGLQFLSAVPEKAHPALSASHMEETMEKLRNRVKNRLSLQKQIMSLEKGSIPVTGEYASLFPTKLTSRLVSWKRSTYEDFTAAGYTTGLLSCDLVRDSDLFFTAVLERGSAKATVQIVVSADYPNIVPLHAICIAWKTLRTVLTDSHVRDMEAEVNVYFKELMKPKSCDQIITNQLQRLLMCFDVYLETEAENTSLEGPPEFCQERNYPRIARGPHRGRAYVFNSQLGFFTQR